MKKQILSAFVANVIALIILCLIPFYESFGAIIAILFAVETVALRFV